MTGRGLRGAAPAVAGIVLSLALLGWALRGVTPAEVLGHIRAARTAPLLAAIALATSTFVLRLFRWRLLLRDERGEALPAGPLWHAIALGFAANNLLLFRAGELVRTYTAVRLARTRFTAALSSVAVERIFDGLTVVALLVVGLWTAGLPPSVSVGGVAVARVAQVSGAVAAAALLAAVLVVARPLAAEAIVRRLLPPGRAADRLVGAIEGIRHGLAALRSPALLAGAVWWSLAVWLVNALAFYVGFAAFGIPVDFAGALVVQGVLAIGISLPSTPGFIGPFEAAIVAVLALYGVPHDTAFSYAITFHLTTFLPIVLLGWWSLERTPIALRDLRPQPE